LARVIQKMEDRPVDRIMDVVLLRLGPLGLELLMQRPVSQRHVGDGISRAKYVGANLMPQAASGKPALIRESQ
jgi:hypothetical protein